MVVQRREPETLHTIWYEGEYVCEHAVAKITIECKSRESRQELGGHTVVHRKSSPIRT